MAPVQLQKRERRATPNFNTHDNSIGRTLVETLGLVAKAGDTLVGAMETNIKADQINSTTDAKRNLFEAQQEEERVTKLLQNPAMTPEEAFELSASQQFGLAQVAAKNVSGELRAQQNFEATSLAVGEASDAIEAREILAAQLGKSLEGVEDPAVRDGITQRYADFAPKMLAAASQRRFEHQALTETLARDEDFKLNLTESPEAFVTTLRGHMFTEATSTGNTTKIIDQAGTALSNFYNEGVTPEGDNPNAYTALAALDQLIDDPMSTEGASRKRLLALRDSLETTEEQRVSGTLAIETDLKRQTFLEAQVQAMDLQRKGMVIPDALYSVLSRNAQTDSELNQVQRLTDNFDAPGLSGTQEARDARSTLRAEIHADPASATFDANSLVGVRFFDKGVRAMQHIDDPFQRATALEALAQRAKVEVGNATAREEALEAEFQQMQERNAVEFQELYDSGATVRQIQQRMGGRDPKWHEFRQNRFKRELAEWARSSGIALQDLDI